MAYVAGYSMLVDAVMPYASWNEAYFALLSLKAHLQALPGFQRMDIHARDLVSGDVKITIVTDFELLEQIMVWAEIGVTPEGVLHQVTPPPLSVTSDMREIVV